MGLCSYMYFNQPFHKKLLPLKEEAPFLKHLEILTIWLGIDTIAIIVLQQ